MYKKGPLECTKRSTITVCLIKDAACILLYTDIDLHRRRKQGGKGAVAPPKIIGLSERFESMSGVI